MAAEHFDVLVVGSGAGGGVVASRLSEDERCRVLLLEAGRDYPDEAVNPPGFVFGGSCGGGYPPTAELDWGYESEPLPDGTRLPLWRGRVVGGTTMTNGCVWVRGRPTDFDAWADAAGDAWAWPRVKMLYEAVEEEIPAMVYARDLWRPAHISLADACLELGFRWQDDMNAPDAWTGVVGPWPRNRRNEVRQGSLVTYLRRARGRPNFTLRDRVLVDRVLLEGTRARGVLYIDADRQLRQVWADHIVLCAGVFGSPPILLRSGIGPAQALRRSGIEPVVDLPVGRSVYDHPYVCFRIRTNSHDAATGWPTHAMVARGDGWFCSAEPVDEDRGVSELAFGVATYDQPEGVVELRSTDPATPPRVDLAYPASGDRELFGPVDDAFMELLETPTYRSLRASRLPDEETPPGRRVIGGTHTAGGCGLGTVLTEDMRVQGVQQLMVADASVFPSHVSNNPNMTCFAVGEAAARQLLRP